MTIILWENGTELGKEQKLFQHFPQETLRCDSELWWSLFLIYCWSDALNLLYNYEKNISGKLTNSKKIVLSMKTFAFKASMELSINFLWKLSTLKFQFGRKAVYPVPIPYISEFTWYLQKQSSRCSVKKVFLQISRNF